MSHTEFESGALTKEMNSLVLFADNTRTLAEMRDRIFKESGDDTPSLIEFYKSCVDQYNREKVSDEPLELSTDHQNDFVTIYRKDYENWEEDNLRDVSQSSEPVLEVLSNCTVDGMIVRLPPKQLERGLYNEVKDKLEKIGGKWKGGKIAGFVFHHDPAELLNQVAAGANRNLKKEFQFFETPETLADFAIEKAGIQSHMSVCEPEAGRAALIKSMRRKGHLNQVWVWELDARNHPELEKYGCYINGLNFLADDPQFYDFFDRIIANPPFTNNQDIDHIRQMWKYLKPGGKLVSYASIGLTFNSNKKPTEFRDWLNEMSAVIHPIERGAFKESGTMVEAVMIVIDKPKKE